MTCQKKTSKSSEHSRKSLATDGKEKTAVPQKVLEDVAKVGEPVESSWESLKEQWCDISEVIESDFLISPGDIYPNRKVQLEDADIKDSTKIAFESLCEKQQETFLKNNKDIGRTQLIEMEIDMGDSLPVAQ